ITRRTHVCRCPRAPHRRRQQRGDEDADRPLHLPAAARMSAPLEGLRLLDLSTVVAGPFAAELLGHLGMDVIRIQPPPAEEPWPAKPQGAPVTEPEGFTWSLARNKRSICLDLKSEAGRAVFLDLVREADIVYENFRPGVMARLRLDHATLAAVNP